MDLLTHSLVGVHLSRLRSFRDLPQGIRFWTAIAASNFPDLDRLRLLAGESSLLSWPVGPGHSLLGVTILLGALGGAASLGVAKEARGRLWALVALGLALHLGFDALTIWSLPLLWPISPASVGLGWVHRSDAWLWALLGFPLLRSWWKSRSHPLLLVQNRGPSVTVLVGLYVAVCGVAKGQALQDALAALREEDGRAVAAKAYPVPFGPFLWTTLIRTDHEEWHVGVASVLTSGISPSGVYPTGKADPRVQVALETVAGARYLGGSQALFLASATPLEDDGSFEVALGDLRFSNPFSDKIPWVFWIRIGPDFSAQDWAIGAAPHPSP